MTTENTAGAENSNNAQATAPESGTAPDKQGSVDTLLTDGNNAADAQTAPDAAQDKAETESNGQRDGQRDGGHKPDEAAIPEKYDFADVGGIRVDVEVKDAFSAVARELGLSQEKAQGVLDKMAPAIEKANQAQLASLSTQWERQSREDREFGGEKFRENMAVAFRALEEFGTPELREILNKAALGNHPEIIRLFYRAGKAISTDKVHLGRGASDGKVSGDRFGDMAYRMYRD